MGLTILLSVRTVSKARASAGWACEAREALMCCVARPPSRRAAYGSTAFAIVDALKRTFSDAGGGDDEERRLHGKK